MNHPLGQLAALVSALAWAGALVLFKRSGERVPPIALNLLKNAVGIVLFMLTLFAMAAFDLAQASPGGEHDAAGVFRLSGYDYGILTVSGVIGIAVADTLLFYGLNLIGVGLVSIVDCLYSPCVLLFAWLMLGETLLPYHYAGGALILAGILVVSGHKPPAGRTRGQILFGMLLIVVAISAMAFGIVLAKPILPDVPLIWATTVRLLAGTAALLILALLLPARGEYLAVFRPARVWRYAIPAAFLGMYLSLMAWMAGFKYTYASVAAVLNQTSVIFALILASVFLKERFGPRKLLAAELALAGVFIITFHEGFVRLANQPWALAAAVAALASGPICYQLFLKARAATVPPALPEAPVKQEKPQ